MKKIISALCFIPSLIWGLTFESDRMEDLLPHVTSETWVLIDADNTLFESSLHLGSAQWRNHIRKKIRNEGFSTEETELALDQFWFFVQPFVPVRSVDSKTPSLIDHLQEAKIPVLVLTARDPIEKVYTEKQIDSIHVHLSNAFPEPFFFTVSDQGLYEKGIIYCGGNTKGEALAVFFEKVGYWPKKIVFIDDRAEQLNNVGRGIEGLGIEFVGIRFSKADPRVCSFDPQIADLQFSLLPKIITDEEAMVLLTQR